MNVHPHCFFFNTFGVGAWTHYSTVSPPARCWCMVRSKIRTHTHPTIVGLIQGQYSQSSNVLTTVRRCSVVTTRLEGLNSNVGKSIFLFVNTVTTGEGGTEKQTGSWLNLFSIFYLGATYISLIFYARVYYSFYGVQKLLHHVISMNFSPFCF